MNADTLARDLAALAHAHYVTPDTLDQGLGDGLVERIQEKLKAFETGHERCSGCGKSISPYCEVCPHLLQT